MFVTLASLRKRGLPHAKITMAINMRMGRGPIRLSRWLSDGRDGSRPITAPSADFAVLMRRTPGLGRMARYPRRLRTTNGRLHARFALRLAAPRTRGQNA